MYKILLGTSGNRLMIEMTVYKKNRITFQIGLGLSPAPCVNSCSYMAVEITQLYDPFMGVCYGYKQ